MKGTNTMNDKAVEALEPEFDATVHEQEILAIQFCAEIAGARGKAGTPPDPVRLLEMAAALYKAERKAYLTALPPATVDEVMKLEALDRAVAEVLDADTAYNNGECEQAVLDNAIGAMKPALFLARDVITRLRSLTKEKT